MCWRLFRASTATQHLTRIRQAKACKYLAAHHAVAHVRLLDLTLLSLCPYRGANEHTRWASSLSTCRSLPPEWSWRSAEGSSAKVKNATLIFRIRLACSAFFGLSSSHQATLMQLFLHSLQDLFLNSESATRSSRGLAM